MSLVMAALTTLLALVVSLAGVANGASDGLGATGSCIAPSCLVVDGYEIRCDGSGQYLPHPTECHQYFECTSAGPVLMSCPPGTAWDQGLLTCAHEVTVDCNKKPKLCDCECCFKADAEDPKSFYYCETSVDGHSVNPFKLSCTEGKTFDQSATRCV